MTFNEYLNTDTENYDAIFQFYLEFLSQLPSKKYPFEEQIKLKGASSKFLICLEKSFFIPKEKSQEYSELVESFSEKLRFYRRTMNRSGFSLWVLGQVGRISLNKIHDMFERLYSMTLEIINEVARFGEINENLELNGFYQPKNSNKIKIRDLINEAIDLVESDENITDKSKKQIIDYLNKVLIELNREHINWSRLIGRIKETIIVLGALGSISGGISPLIQAKDKLEETTVVIQQTSINLNYNVLNETFHVQNIKQLGPINNVVLQISESNKVQEHE